MQSSKMLAEWLAWMERKDSSYPFLVIDVSEKGGASEQLLESLGDCIKNAYFDPDALGKLIKEYGVIPVHERIVTPSIPTLKTVKRVTTDAIQVMGGYGYMRDHPAERMFRGA